MSGDTQEQDTKRSEELSRELRQFTELAASFFRAAAARLGMTITDLQVLDILERSGPSTAGQLADLTGLTTGAITGMLNRLEETGLVRRERDPNDGRRVIVQLAKGQDETSIFAALGNVWDELAAGYDDEQVAFLLEFLKRSNTLYRNEMLSWQGAPASAGEIFSAPLANLPSGQLVVAYGVSRLIIDTAVGMADLYQARFEGPVPDVGARDGIVAIRYPRRLLSSIKLQRTAQVTLNVAIPWKIMIQGGASDVSAELDGLNLTSLEVKGGLSSIRLKLPRPSGVVPIRISGGASEISVRRPVGVAARAHLKGWVSTFIFDEQAFSDMGNNVWLQSSNFKANGPYYDIEVASSASMVTITSG